jgi:hypothetical protein
MPEDIESSLEAALQEAKTALADTERRRAELELQVRSLQAEVAGIEAALRRRRKAASPVVSGPLTTLDPKLLATSALPGSPAAAGVAALVLLMMGIHTNWTNKKRAATVEWVLKVADGPVHRTDVAEALERLGRSSDTLESVSAALAYLNRSGRAHPVGDGYWAAGVLPTPTIAKGVN